MKPDAPASPAAAAPPPPAKPAGPEPRGLQMEDLHKLIGELYLEIHWLRSEVKRLSPPPG